MIRESLHAALKDASDTGDARASSTLRLVLAALNERDHCAARSGAVDGLGNDEILQMIRDMVEQRRAEINRCEQCARLELAEKEAEEIAVLEQFLPQRMNENEIGDAVDIAIRDTGATKLKDTGKVIAALKERFNGQMDFKAAKKICCARLC